MVQVLDPVPSFGSSLARGIGGGFNQGLSQGSDFTQKMAIQKAKSSDKQRFYESMFGKAQQQESNGQMKPLELSPEQETVLALQDPTAFNAYKHLKESRKAEGDKVKQKEDIQTVLSGITKTIKEGNVGFSPKKYLTEKGRRDAQYIDTLGVQLESIAKEMVSKGVLARDRFAYLLSNIPSSNKTDASNAGAIQAWAEALGVEMPEGVEELYGEKKKVKSGTPLDKKAMEKVFELSGGDKEKAKKIARKMGYEIQ